MTSFDYEGYWLDIVEPAWLSLAPERKQLVRDFMDNDIKQDQRCHIDWDSVPKPLQKTLELMAEQSERDLAMLAVIANDYGHMRPGILPTGKIIETPSEQTSARIFRKEFKQPGEDVYGFKLSLAIDKVLSDRIKCSREGRGYQGFYIHYGVLRLYYRDQDTWVWEEACLATQSNLEKARDHIEQYRSRDIGDNNKKIAREILDLCHPVGDPARPLISHDGYRVSREEEEYRREVRRNPEATRPEPKSNEAKVERLREMLTPDAPVSLVEIRTINHRLKEGVSPVDPKPAHKSLIDTPHAFVIGQKHMKASSGFLDMRAAPCYGCGCKYNDHISDTVLVVHVPEDTEASAIKTALEPLTRHMEKWGVDGFVFTKSEETN